MHTKQNGPCPHFVILGAIGGPRHIGHLHSSSSLACFSSPPSFTTVVLLAPDSSPQTTAPLVPSPPPPPPLAVDPATVDRATVERATVDRGAAAPVGVLSRAVDDRALSDSAGRRFALPQAISSATRGAALAEPLIGLVLAKGVLSRASAASAAAVDAAGGLAQGWLWAACSSCWNYNYTRRR